VAAVFIVSSQLYGRVAELNGNEINPDSLTESIKIGVQDHRSGSAGNPAFF
jgi:hypothetical protein